MTSCKIPLVSSSALKPDSNHIVWDHRVEKENFKVGDEMIYDALQDAMWVSICCSGAKRWFDIDFHFMDFARHLNPS